MGKSLKSRLNGNMPEAVQYAKDFGIDEFMRHYQIKDYISALHFLEDAEPGYRFEMVKKNDPKYLTGYGAAKEFWLVVLENIHQVKAESARKDIQIAELRRELDYYKSAHRNESTDIMQSILRECEKSPA